jgi:hypothetical protein
MRAVVVILAIAGCYAPDLAPCTVQCADGETCPDGEACGTDHFCHASGDHGTCTTPLVTLTIQLLGTGTGAVRDGNTIDCGSRCTATVLPGTSFQLTAYPTSGSRLSTWSGGGCVGGASCSTQIDADTTIVATFNLSVDLELFFNGNGTGRVTSSPAGVDCTYDCTVSFDLGTTVTLTAVPNPGSSFGGFGGACGTTPCMLQLNQQTTVQVRFN